MEVPTGIPENHQHSPDEKSENYKSIIQQSEVERSEALSMAHTRKETVETRRIAIFAVEGVDINQVQSIKKALEDQKAMVKIISSYFGELKSDNGNLLIDESILVSASVLFDALVLPDGTEEMNKLLQNDKRFGEFLQNTYNHCKPIAANGTGLTYMKESLADLYKSDKGVVINKSIDEFIDAVKQHRFWDR